MKEINERKIMYHMIMAIENDLIEYLTPLVSVDDFTKQMYEKIVDRKVDAINIKEMLQQLSLGDFVELVNKCKVKLAITQNELDFLNANCGAKIVEIRNRVMHPKPLLFDDHAVLSNLFEKVDGYIHAVAWANVIGARNELKNNLDMVLSKKVLEYEKSIIDNIPELDCEEIEFVGRGKEIGELNQLLLNEKIRMISIVAAGGYGKTALALKVLNGIKKAKKSPYELIIWISFKTRQLDGTSFTEISDAIINVASMNHTIFEFIGGDDSNAQKELIDLSKQFNTLLVLDNLETIDQQDMMPFIEEFINYGKILITSRVSLGQLDKRYDLQPLNKSDLLEFTNRLLKFYNLDDRFANEDVLNLSETVLFSNPLSIKWAIRSLYGGASLAKIMEDREDVVEFCMSNVYGKIPLLGKNILHLLAFCPKEITKGQIIFYLQKKAEDIVEIEAALLQLTRACFIDKIKMKQGWYALIGQAKIFMDSLTGKEGLYESFANKRRELNTIQQDIDIVSEQEPYGNTTINIFTPTEDNITAAYYLYKAIGLIEERKNFEALEMVKLAENISPKYSECYKVHGLILSYMDKPDAEAMYRKAIETSLTARESLIQHVALANYHIRTNNYRQAYDIIEKAYMIDGNSVYVKLEKIKVLAYLGKYQEAEDVFEQIDPKKLCSPKEQNLYVTRKADLMRREAEQLDDNSQLQQRTDLLCKAFNLLKEEPSPDDYTYTMMCRIASDLTYLSTFESVAGDILKVVFERNESLKKIKAFFEFSGKLRKVLSRIDKKLAEECLKRIYGLNVDNFQNDIGEISYVKDNYGFIVNSKFVDGLYFVNYDNLQKGDKVQFVLTEKYEKLRAINVRKI